jgi:hypothetical protein
MGGIAGGIFFAGSLLYGLAQVAVAFIGIEHYWGFLAAAGIIGLSFFFRFTLPITIGSFFGAYAVMGWPWYWAALFAAPGIAFMFVGALAQGAAGIADRRSARMIDRR